MLIVAISLLKERQGDVIRGSFTYYTATDATSIKEERYNGGLINWWGPCRTSGRCSCSDQLETG